MRFNKFSKSNNSFLKLPIFVNKMTCNSHETDIMISFGSSISTNSHTSSKILKKTHTICLFHKKYCFKNLMFNSFFSKNLYSEDLGDVLDNN